MPLKGRAGNSYTIDLAGLKKVVWRMEKEEIKKNISRKPGCYIILYGILFFLFLKNNNSYYSEVLFL